MMAACEKSRNGASSMPATFSNFTPVSGVIMILARPWLPNPGAENSTSFFQGLFLSEAASPIPSNLGLISFNFPDAASFLGYLATAERKSKDPPLLLPAVTSHWPPDMVPRARGSNDTTSCRSGASTKMVGSCDWHQLH